MRQFFLFIGVFLTLNTALAQLNVVGTDDDFELKGEYNNVFLLGDNGKTFYIHLDIKKGISIEV